VLPVILANTIAYLLARALQPVPIFEIFTHQDGLDLPSMEEQREESDLHLEDAIDRAEMTTFRGSDSPAAMLQVSREKPLAVFLIQCSDVRWYAARRDEIEKMALQEQEGQASPVEVLLGQERTPTLFPDQQLDSALPYFSRWPLLPVTKRAVRGALEGVVTLEGVLKRYQQR
jgi:CIC family chloride channel protein